jgi:galactokinase
LASSEYNRRREECSEGVERIKKSYPDVCHLRDVSVDMMQKCEDNMDPTIYRRCKYVVEENDRVLSACTELEQGNLKAFGVYMNRTHKGLSRDYEVSCTELDYLVELVKDNPYLSIYYSGRKTVCLKPKNPFEGLRACKSNIPKVASMLANSHLDFHSKTRYPCAAVL